MEDRYHIMVNRYYVLKEYSPLGLQYTYFICEIAERGTKVVYRTENINQLGITMNLMGLDFRYGMKAIEQGTIGRYDLEGV